MDTRSHVRLNCVIVSMNKTEQDTLSQEDMEIKYNISPLESITWEQER